MTAPGRMAGGLEGATRSCVAGRPVVLVDDRGGGGALVDAADGIATGISAADRAHTARLLAAPATVPDALTRPGHVAGVRAAGSAS